MTTPANNVDKEILVKLNEHRAGRYIPNAFIKFYKQVPEAITGKKDHAITSRFNMNSRRYRRESRPVNQRQAWKRRKRAGN